jgi:hypothetical protein
MNFWDIAAPYLIPAVIAALGVISKAAWDWFKKKTKLVALDKYYNRANDAVLTAVAETMQTFVSVMKKEGKWDNDAMKKAFNLSMLRAKEIMGAAALEALPEVVGDLTAWLTAKIEAATLELKAGLA